MAEPEHHRLLADLEEAGHRPIEDQSRWERESEDTEHEWHDLRVMIWVCGFCDAGVAWVCRLE